MLKVVMDARCHQAIRELGTEAEYYGNAPDQSGRWRGKRLTGLRKQLSDTASELVFADPDTPNLADAAALIVASRSQLQPFSEGELQAISAFVESGGGLLLMANHRGFIAPQQQLAATLALPCTFNDVSIVNFPPIVAGPHRLCAGATRLRVRNTASLHPVDAAETLAWFASDPSHVFAVACRYGQGRVVITGDSGFIASSDDAGLDLLAADDNARFLDNVLRWLQHLD